jgi:hypothetical protein
MNLLTGTTGQLNQELSSALPSILEIAKASNKMNPTLGDTSFLLESIAEGVKRGSALRIDNAGIILSQAEASAKYAEKIGVSADALTEEQKKIALLHETLRQGETIIAQAGGSVESYTDSWSQMRAEFKSAVDELKASTAEMGGPMVQRLAELARAYNETDKKALRIPLHLQAIATAIGYTSPIVGEYKKEMLESADASDRFLDITDRIRLMFGDAAVQNALTDQVGTLKGWVAMADRYAVQAGLIEQSSLDAAGGIGELSSEIDAYVSRIEEAASIAQEFWADRRAARATYILDAAQSDLGDTLFENSQEVHNLRQEQDQLLTQIRELEQQHGRAITVQNKSALSTHELALAQMDLAEAQERVAEADPDSRDFHEAAQDVADLQEKIGGATGATTAYIDKSKEISELRSQYEEVGAGIDEVISKSREAINQFLLQQMHARLSVDGWNEAELVAFETFAKGTGQYDQVWVQATRGIEQSATALETFEGNAQEAFQTGVREGRNMLGVSQDLRGEFSLLRDDGPQAMSAIESGADEARGQIDSMVGSTVTLNEELGKLESRKVTIDVDFNVAELRLPSAISREGLGTPDPEMMADGGYLRPGATALAGEEGIEAVRALSGGGVQVVPLRGSGGNGGGGGGGSRRGGNVTIQIYGGDLAEVRRVVEGVLIDQGIVSYHGLRG